MTDSEPCDVFVAGLGPAGSRAATAAAAAGLKVIAADRKRSAGFPVQCAEFVPAMIGQELAQLDKVTRQRVRRMMTFVEDRPPDLKDNFPGHMIDRESFDQALVLRAMDAGADCRFDAPVKELLPDGAVCLSDAPPIRARAIIGADGPRSLVGRAIGQVNRALVDTRQITVPLRQAYDATDIFLSAEIPGGYGWLFPKGEVAHLGLGAVPSARSRLKPLLAALHRQMIAEGRVGADILAHTGGAIPVGGLLHPRGQLGGVPVLLTGDAAGLTNPVTGAGINAAVISGALAGEAAAAWLAGTADALSDYDEDLQDLFGAALDRAVRRRQEVLQRYDHGHGPSDADLRRGWIAYPEYWAA